MCEEVIAECSVRVSCCAGPEHAPDIDPLVDSITTEEGLESSECSGKVVKGEGDSCGRFTPMSRRLGRACPAKVCHFEPADSSLMLKLL